MGCDIHIVLERKFDNTPGAPWIGVRHLTWLNGSALRSYDAGQIPASLGWIIRERNYEFFNDLCGVRGDGSAFEYTDRGLPDDVSQLAAAILGDDSDLHSHSWLTMDELEPVLLKHFENVPNTTVEKVTARLRDEESVDVLRKYVDGDIGDSEYHPRSLWRLVFAFDN